MLKIAMPIKHKRLWIPFIKGGCYISKKRIGLARNLTSAAASPGAYLTTLLIEIHMTFLF